MTFTALSISSIVAPPVLIISGTFCNEPYSSSGVFIKSAEANLIASTLMSVKKSTLSLSNAVQIKSISSFFQILVFLYVHHMFVQRRVGYCNLGYKNHL